MSLPYCAKSATSNLRLPRQKPAVGTHGNYHLPLAGKLLEAKGHHIACHLLTRRPGAKISNERGYSGLSVHMGRWAFLLYDQSLSKGESVRMIRALEGDTACGRGVECIKSKVMIET